MFKGNKPSKWAGEGTAIVRILTGLLLVYHGYEVFDSKLMGEYAKWDMFKNLDYGLLMVYLGKGAEFVGGLLLTLGLYTRLASLIIIIDLLTICFFVGHGKIWYEDQHPFLFVLIAIIYFLNGAGIWSLDKKTVI